MEIAIVGSGVAGSLMAWRLAQARHRVTLIEAGPRVDRKRALARYREAAVKQPHTPYPQNVPGPRIDDHEAHYRQQGPELFMGLYERLAGGTTWHWLGTALRLLPEDFELHSRFGVGRDWPLDYAELQPFYLEAERQLGVSGPDGLDFGSPRRGDYPMPALPQAEVDSLVAAAAAQLGGRVLPLPQARNSRRYRGRPACCGSASCIPICPIAAKYDAGVHLTRAETAGATLRENTVVTKLESAPGGHIRRAHWRCRDGSEGALEADLFVLACHAIETPRLLLESNLANRSEQVGRNLMGAAAQLSWGLAPQPVYPYRAPQATSGLFEGRSGPQRRQRAGFVTTIATDGWPDNGPADSLAELVGQGLRGPALREALRELVARQFALVSTCEVLPNPDNRVELDPDFRDALGRPRPRLRYRAGEYAEKGLAAARESHQSLLETMGASRIAHSSGADPGYILGTTRMGNDPSDSVVDRNLICHQHPNLMLVGSGVFPTAGTAPPTLTVAALALRAAQFVLNV